MAVYAIKFELHGFLNIVDSMNSFTFCKNYERKSLFNKTESTEISEPRNERRCHIFLKRKNNLIICITPSTFTTSSRFNFNPKTF